MRNYLRLLFMFVLMAFATALPVLADGFDEVVVSFEMGIPNAPPEVTPPDIRIESAYYNLEKHFPADALSRHETPIDQLIPRPGWQSESAREVYNEKKKLLLSQERRS